MDKERLQQFFRKWQAAQAAAVDEVMDWLPVGQDGAQRKFNREAGLNMTFQEFKKTAKRKGKTITYSFPGMANVPTIEDTGGGDYVLTYRGSRFEADKKFCEWVLYGYLTKAFK